jgi:hypothetical protein
MRARPIVAIVLLLAAAPVGAAKPSAADLFAACRRERSQKIVKLQLRPDSRVIDVISLMKALSCSPVDIAGGAASRDEEPAELQAPEPLTYDEVFRLMETILVRVGLQVVVVSPQRLRVQLAQR